MGRIRGASLAVVAACLPLACSAILGIHDIGETSEGGSESGSDAASESGPDSNAESSPTTDAADSALTDRDAGTVPNDSGYDGEAGVPVAPVSIPVPSTADIIAPSGTPGQRHLLYVPDSWWVFYLDSPTALNVLQTPDHLPIVWSNSSLPAVTSYTFASAAALDGRLFGLDVTESGDVHLAMSAAGVTQPKSHILGTLNPNGGLMIGAATSLGAYQTTGLDGVVTAVEEPEAGAGATLNVLDYGSVLPVADAAAQAQTGAFQLDDTGHGAFSVSSFATVHATSSPVVTRAALPAAGGFTAVWNEEGSGIQVATYSTASSSWSATSPLDTTSSQLVTRSWTACALLGSGAVHVLWSTPQGGFVHMEGSGGGWGSAAAPPLLGVAAVELFAACGPTGFTLFTVAPPATSGFAAGTILMSSWGGSAFTPWVAAVAPPGGATTRCFLSGFDRVVSGSASDPGPHVGLLWTESSSTSCQTAQPTNLSMAVVPVPP